MTTTSMITTALQTVGVKVDMDDAIVLLDITDVPLQRSVGSVPCNEIRVDWLEDEFTPSTCTAASVVGTASPWTVTMGTDEGDAFRVGDILHLVGAAFDRQFKVTAVSGDDLTLASFGATTDSNDPAASDVFELIGQLPHEGGDPDEIRAVDRTNPFNYTQIAQEGLQVSRTQRKRALYGVSDEYTYQLQKKFKELNVRNERSMVNGYRYQSGDQRFMGGLLFYVTTNSESNTSANAKTAVNALVRDCYEFGGTPHTMFVSPAVKAAISANFDPTLRRVARDDRTGGYVVERITTDFGDVDLVVDRHLPTTKGVLVQSDFIKRRTFDPVFHEFLAKTGDADKGQIVSELSLEVKNEKAHGVLTLTDAS